MEFELTPQMELIYKAAKEVSEKFPPEYWRLKEERHEFAEEFWRAISEAGFTGVVIPEEYGGAGLGLQELALVMEALSSHGAGLAGVWYLMLTEVFVGIPLVRYGTEGQKNKYLDKIAKGEYMGCLALTEPIAGSNTFKISTIAEKRGGEYVINGNKVFISGVDKANVMVLVARTIPFEEARDKSHGITLFLIDLPNESVRYKGIPKHGVNYSGSFEVTISDLRVGEESILGPEGYGWYVLLDILNPERIGFSVGAIGTAELAIKRAVEYSKVRRVFEDPIGSYQSLQHPLAEAYAFLQAAKVLTYKAAWLFDTKNKPPKNPKDVSEIKSMAPFIKEVGNAANMAKIVAVKSAIEAVYWAMQVFGGYGYAKEFDVERWWREVNLLRLAPVTHQMALNYVGQHILGMPRSYR